jgi:general secretion pathway protein B
MSYILDALRKSEKDRKRDETPMLHTVHTSRQAVPAGKNIFSSKLLRWIVVLLTLFIIALGISIRQGLLPISKPEQPDTNLAQQQKLAPPTENQKTENSLSEQEAAERLQHDKALIAARAGSNASLKTIAEKDPTLSSTAIQEPAPLTVTQGKDNEMSVINRKFSDTPTSNQLPPSVQADVGKMKFAGHVYSEDTAGRMIMINNKILREGDTIDTEFRLQEITKSGVVLVYKSTPFRIDLF